MNSVVGDILSIGTDGWWKQPEVADVPAAPSLGVQDGETGDSVVATVAGDDDVLNLVYYRETTSGTWTLGGSRTGDGVLTIEDLEQQNYAFVAVSQSASGSYSLPSAEVHARVTAGTSPDLLAEIAQAVTDELNAYAFSQDFTAERAYLPVSDLKDSKDLAVRVVPRTMGLGMASRAKLQHDYQVDVSVQQKLTDIAVGPDPLRALVLEIIEFFKMRRLEDMPEVACMKVENAPVYLPEHLEQLRQFTSVVTFTFRTFR